MKKVFLSIGIVLLAMVVLVGCEEGSNTGGSNSGDLSDETQATLFLEGILALNEAPAPAAGESTGSSYSFEYTLSAGYDDSYSLVFSSPPQYIGSGANVEGTITVTGMTVGQWQSGDDSSLAPGTEVSLTYSLTITATEIPGGSVTIVVAMSGPFDADEPEEFTVRINGELVAVEYPSSGF